MNTYAAIGIVLIGGRERPPAHGGNYGENKQNGGNAGQLMNVTSAIPTPIVAAEGSNYWQSVSQSIANAIDSALPYVWILVSLAIIGVGLLCIIGSDRSKEVAKSKFVYICIGAALVLAAAYIGKGITSALNGAGDWSSVVS